ncbi:Pentatricopeptide repeat-containing protein [Quillaja saponaria]|uniref:Pentatricopeptide repeat-containing protein n=1 Tax=Quillaja saponaria TaxID=32244 RepID=A0AAD7QBI5_QUISA|nr:Pentatricopeptide repeat-containing protein [Quillaja saponaria]
MFMEETIPANFTSSRAIQQYLFSLLQSCNTIRRLPQIHTQVVVNGFSQKNFILVKLLSVYIESGRFQHAQNVFEKIENPSTTVWNQMIRGYGRSEKLQKAIEFYRRMVADEAEPDGFTYSCLLSACARCELLREGEQLHSRVLANGYSSNVFVQTSLVNLYARGGGDSAVAQARRVFDDMTLRSVVSWNSLLAGYVRLGDFDSARRVFEDMPERNVVSWTTMIAGYAKNGRSKQSLSLFAQMMKVHVALDQVALVAALSACAELGDLRLGRWIHRYVEERLHDTNQLSVVLSNALMHMYSSCGVIHEAYKVFNKMPKRSIVSWTSIIMAFAKQGHGEEALNIFRTMISLGVDKVRPDEITFIGVLCACSHAGFVDEGCQIFECMDQTWGIIPKIEHYGCMVDLLSRAGFLDEAHRLIETMPMKPNDAVWGALLGGCRIHKNAELATRVAQKLLIELNPDRAAGYLVLLSNVYSFAKRWQDVITVRQKIIDMGVKKPSGRSWVQINGVINDFMAGDMTHKHSSFIYEILCEITRLAHQEGCEPDIPMSSLNVEE